MLNIATFRNNTDHMSKINYLQSIGIESNNTSEKYDFSHIKQEQTRQQKSAVAPEEEEVLEDGEENMEVPVVEEDLEDSVKENGTHKEEADSQNKSQIHNK